MTFLYGRPLVIDYKQRQTGSKLGQEIAILSDGHQSIFIGIYLYIPSGKLT